ncbi:MAG: SnoaL-like domain, partial [Solirubrobacterales bacterium]|nr:SnoaL-like domain [Solirubrobacterales bacterium]
MSEDAVTPDLAERVRLLFAAASRHDLDTLMSFYAPDAVWETTLVTLDGSTAIQERFEEWFGA